MWFGLKKRIRKISKCSKIDVLADIWYLLEITRKVESEIFAILNPSKLGHTISKRAKNLYAGRSGPYQNLHI